MIAFFARFGVAIHVALLVVWASWARGGSSPAYFWALPWISLGILEVMALMPPRPEGMSPRSALRHLLRKIIADPIFYFGVILLGFLLIQWLNGPVELEFDMTDSKWRYTDPKLPGMPFCADQDEASQILVWFSAVLTALLAVRHAMGPKSRLLLLRIFVLNGALLSILGFMQLVSSPDKLFWYRPMSVYFFSTFGYPNHAGAFFVLTSAVNMGLFIRAVAETDDANHPVIYGISLLLNIVAVYGSLCRAAMVLETLLVLFALIYGAIYLRHKVSRGFAIKIFAALLVLVGCAAAQLSKPGSDLAKEVKTITAESMANVYEGDRAQLVSAALDIWKDYPWTGVGGWGFRRYVALYIGEENWGLLKEAGKANVHNDIVQFLCEHGAIGGGLIIALAMTLLVHLAIRLALMKRRTEPDTEAQCTWFGSIPPVVVMSLAGCFCTVVHSTIDLPFRSTAVLLSWFIVLACLPGLVHRR